MQFEVLVKKVSDLIARAETVESSWQYERTAGGWFEDKVGYEALMTEVLSVVEYIYGMSHPHYQRILNSYNQRSKNGIQSVRGILIGISGNIDSGLLIGLADKLVIEISNDFLDTARAFAEAGDKDPASVLACCVLEDSVKRLAEKHKVDGAKDQEFSVVINSLLSRRIIEKSVHSTLNSFRSLRNAAFHAQWHEVSIEAVNVLLMFLPVFIERNGVKDAISS